MTIPPESNPTAATEADLSTAPDIALVSLDTFLASPSSPEAAAEARKAAESLILTGALVVRDSRASKDANDRFLDLFEDYFAQDERVLKGDERPEWGYQVVSDAFSCSLAGPIARWIWWGGGMWKGARERCVMVKRGGLGAKVVLDGDVSGYVIISLLVVPLQARAVYVPGKACGAPQHGGQGSRVMTEGRVAQRARDEWSYPREIVSAPKHAACCLSN